MTKINIELKVIFVTKQKRGSPADTNNLDINCHYVSPYLVVTPQGYTKHYYAESERITTQLGKYRFAVVDSCVAGDSLVPIKLQDAARAFPTDSFPTPTAQLGYLHSLTNHPNTASTLYFYHPDHLGSASWITNIYGRTIQHLYYLPWGEDFVNQKTTSFSSMYTFSAKEKDAETGYSYFGSRYYSSDLSIWLSVDPMAAKYPSLSPYTYCADNPVKLVDPNGDTLVVPDNIDSHNDILSIVNEYNKHRITFGNDGKVSVNMDNLKVPDAGLSLINDMVSSDKRYYYETSDVALCRNEKGKRDYLPLTAAWTQGTLNASTGGLDFLGKHTYLPIEGFDGQVVISKTGSFHYGLWNRRRNIVFHELAENYLRTDIGMNYGNPVGSMRGGAHQAASRLEADAWGTYEPGTTYFTPGNPESTNSDNDRIKKYLNDGIYK